MYPTIDQLNALRGRVNGRIASAQTRVGIAMNGRVPEEIQYATWQALQMHPDVIEKKKQEYGPDAWSQSEQAMGDLGARLRGQNA